MSDPRAALDAARFVLSAASATPAPGVWASAQHVLRAVIGRSELSGQALIGETRRMGSLTLSDAHALVALATWADRNDRPAESDSERALLRESLIALEHAVDMNRAVAAEGAIRPTVNDIPAVGSTPWAASGTAYRNSPGTARETLDAFAPEAPVRRRFSAALLIGGFVLVLVLALAAGARWMIAERSERPYREGVAAYSRGAREVARAAFVKAVRQHPDDAGPLIFLGRIAREDGDLPRARRFLTTAVRLAPNSARATRELASVMLVDGQPELARRFYVRALQIDPTDRVAKGFLGCALFRLNRFGEARRWTDRAGPGDWTPCVAAMPLAIPQVKPVPVPPPGARYPTQSFR